MVKLTSKRNYPKFLQPEVHLLARTTLNEHGVRDFLDGMGVGAWDTDSDVGAQVLFEIAGKTCYMSFALDLNKNLTRIRTAKNHNYIQRLIEQEHTSIFEHAQLTFGITNISRVCTHELVRHSVGCAVSQTSGRYVRPPRNTYYMPSLEQDPGAQERFMKSILKIEKEYEKMEKYLFWTDSHPMGLKKRLTSSARRLLPNGVCTNIVFTANIRALMHIIRMRDNVHAEEEIRNVAQQMKVIAQQELPHVFYEEG